MPLDSESRAHYEFILRKAEVEQQQAVAEVQAAQDRVKEVNAFILSVKRRLNADAPSTNITAHRSANRQYANMSVRWAILDLLHDSDPMNTSEIADALKTGGVESRAANFANNVSAVLSTTMKDERHKEVQQLPDGKWELTEKGRDAIAHIRTTPKFRFALQGREQRFVGGSQE